MDNKILCCDVIDGLKQIDRDSVSLIFTSPPYNVDIKYDNRDDTQPFEEYLKWMKDVFEEAYKTLRIGGRLAINIDSIKNREDVENEYGICIYAHLYNMMKEIGYNFRTDICWYKQNAVGRGTAWGSYCSCSNPTLRRNHEYILVWSKGDWKLDGDPELSDMTKEEFCQYIYSTWFIPPETRKLGGHPVPFPEELARRIIKLYSYREDIVLDPFVGSGTTTAVAASLGRRWVGIDNSQKYVDFSRRRTLDKQSEFNTEQIISPYVGRTERLAMNKSTTENLQEEFYERF